MRLPRSLVFTLCITLFCRAGPATTQSIDAHVDQVIAQLASDDWATRKKAQDDLIKLGEPALARLHAAAQSATDPESRSRIKTAILFIERKSADVPTRISLHLHNTSPKNALEALAAQSGIQLNAWPPNIWEYGPHNMVTLDLDDATFWTAMRALCDQADLTFQNVGQRLPAIQRGNSAWSRAVSLQHGPYLVVAEYISKNQSISLDNPKEIQRSAVVNISIWPEFKVRIPRYSTEPVIESMVDETGASLLPENWHPNPPNLIPVNQMFPFRYGIPIEATRKLGSRIATLKGSVKFRVLTKRGQLIFEDPVKAGKTTLSAGGKRIVLNSCRQNPDHSYSIDVTIFREGFSDDDWNDMLQNHDQFRLVDSQGVYRPNGFSAGWSEKQYQTSPTLYLDKSLTSDVRGDDKPRLIWDFAQETREVSVPFEFKDLPLPN